MELSHTIAALKIEMKEAAKNSESISYQDFMEAKIDFLLVEIAKLQIENYELNKFICLH